MIEVKVLTEDEVINLTDDDLQDIYGEVDWWYHATFHKHEYETFGMSEDDYRQLDSELDIYMRYRELLYSEIVRRGA